jgi:hypothetical protein
MYPVPNRSGRPARSRDAVERDRKHSRTAERKCTGPSPRSATSRPSRCSLCSRRGPMPMRTRAGRAARGAGPGASVASKPRACAQDCQREGARARQPFRKSRAIFRSHTPVVVGRSTSAGPTFRLVPGGAGGSASDCGRTSWTPRPGSGDPLSSAQSASQAGGASRDQGRHEYWRPSGRRHPLRQSANRFSTLRRRRS